MKKTIRYFKELNFLILSIALGLCCHNNISAQQLYPATFDVIKLNGANGFVIPGIDESSQFGAETKFIGDINNDGFEDIAVGVNNADINGLSLAGAVYVVFGTDTEFSASFDITTLNGVNGFVVEGMTGSTRMGSSVEGVGDINGDGIDDLVIVSSGDTMVIYGKTTAFSATFNIDYADGVNGFLIQKQIWSANDISALGDINGDGINDFILGHGLGDVTWVFFGRTSNFPASVDVSWLDGTNGFKTSDYTSSRGGFLVGGAGDINNDGFNDIIIGEWSSSGSLADGGQRTRVLFGKPSFDATVDVENIDSSNGFTIDNSGGGFLVFVGSLGDINGDGIDDFYSEQSAVYGKDTSDSFPDHIPLSSIEDNSLGFRLPGSLTSSSIGDVNNDGIDDFIAVYNSDEAYVIFGSSTGFPNPINSTTLDGTNGFTIPGFKSSNIGRPVSGGGDFNGDGISDFIIGNPFDKPLGSTITTGEAYVVFGGDHYANPLTTNYPQAINETSLGFTLLVNGPEKGTIHYAVISNTNSSLDYNDILAGTGADANGSFLMNKADTDTEKIISSLLAEKIYDVYLFLEDEAGNQSEIYKIDNVTTLSAPLPFITTWATTTDNETITVPTTGTGYDYTIDWGDGTIETNQTGNATHTYTTAGTQTLNISGDFPRIYFNNSGDKDKILTIEQWGDIAWNSMERAFYGCTNLNISNTTIDLPDLSMVTDMSFMFQFATSFDGDISSWNVSNVTNMSQMFLRATSFNQPLNWDVSNVTTMRSMFYGVTSFNQPLNWDVSNVTNMDFMFGEATSFNQPLNWDVSNVTTMAYMFHLARLFNQNLSSWDVSNVTTMAHMFHLARLFNQNLSSWDVSNVTNMLDMFREVTLSEENYDALLKGWSTQTLQTGVSFNGGNSKYCGSETERQSIIDTYGWTIKDGGKCKPINWTGATDNNWNVATNWSTNTVPTIANDVIIPSNLTNYPSASATVAYKSLTINSGATFIPESTATGDVIYNIGIADTNWHLIASPVNGETYDNIITNHTFASGTGGNIGLAPYDNSLTNSWNYYNLSSTGSISSGTGISVKLATAGNISFNGASLNVTDTNTTIGLGVNAFNLLGNPFTAYINSNNFTATNTASFSEETIWLWNGTTYETYNAMSPIEIAPAQGFFVKANASITNGTNVTFEANNRSHQATNTFLKQEAVPSFELFVTNDNSKQVTKVFYATDKTTGFDNGYDSNIFEGTTYEFTLFTELITNSKGEKLAIQTLPDNDYENMVIPLGVVANLDEEIIFSVASFNLPDDIEIYLEDKINNTFTNLSESEYKTVLTNGSESTGQFYVHTKAGKSLSIDDAISNLNTINIYKSSENEITITGVTAPATITVYSLLGKEVSKTKLNSTGVSKVNLPKLSTGVYVVKVNSVNGEITKKITLN